MKLVTGRRTFLSMLVSAIGWCCLPARGQTRASYGSWRSGKDPGHKRDADNYLLPRELAEFGLVSLVLGRVSNHSVTVSTLATDALEGYLEYGEESGKYSAKTDLLDLGAGMPVEQTLDKLQPNTAYFYRLQCRKKGETEFHARPEGRFHTQRVGGSAFTFAVQGDSHPERPQMNDANLYARTLLNAVSGKPDFYICMGDDFSVDALDAINTQTVAGRYRLQRPFLGLIAQSAPLFLVNGNHEQASLFNFNQTDMRHDIAVDAQNARNRYYPCPAPDGFYSGDADELKSIGLLKDYYAWTWGDALFVVLDNYWHSPGQVDNPFHDGGGKGPDQHGNKDRDWWQITLGDVQYQWFKKTLEQSKASFKFVFAHHVLGTGRGGIEECDLFEWGGKDKRGNGQFEQKRPGWELPIHQLMAKHGVTIFFQGHDHLYARQERDGIVYQEVPMPADQNYMTYNDDRYPAGVKMPNSGYLRVAVAPEQVKVEYVRCYLPKDETDQHQTGEVAHSYTIKAKA